MREDLQAAEAKRTATSDQIVQSDAPKRLIIAGPGTGKTYNFRRALEAVGGNGLALTFIRALVRDLERDLGDLAQVSTLHAYCKHLAYKLSIDGLARGFDYYPPLLVLIAEDMRLLDRGHSADRELERALRLLDDGEGLITSVLELGTYYNTVSHTDVVYRVLSHFEAHPDSVQKFPLVVVDEYQDFCLLETRFIEALETVSPVLVAGDDDQALYSFKDASADFIRALAEDPEYERFQLPYCTRCTEVIVDAVNNVVERAKREGNLADRLDREYLCYLPKKEEDSKAHPSIIWAECTVNTNKSPYVGMYVTEQIAAIPAADIEESHKERYPTALVIGRRHIVKRVYDVIKERFPNAVMPPRSELTIDSVHGYRRLGKDPESQLGWRILLHTDPFPGANKKLAEALAEQKPLTEILPDDYRAHHLEIAQIFEALLYGEGLTDAQIDEVLDKLGRSWDDIQAALGRDEEGEEAVELPPEDGVPSIMCTTLLGAKGLSAGYVFIVGFNDGTFPADPTSITDDEVCKLIVGLSRTRKECHLVSCKRLLGVDWTEPSTFLKWLDVAIEKREINKAYLAGRNAAG
jgi:superfamily I DNA/RNA helicase